MNVAADTIQQTMLTKVHTPLAARGTCNSGFMRVTYRRRGIHLYLHYSTVLCAECSECVYVYE